MTDRCRWFEKALAAREADTLRPEDEAEIRPHLEACAPCRESALERDPALLFLLLGGGGRDEVFWGRFWRDLQPALDAAERDRLGRIGGRAATWGALAAAGTGLAAGLLLALSLVPGPAPGPEELTPVASAHPARPEARDDAREYFFQDDEIPVLFIVDRRIDL